MIEIRALVRQTEEYQVTVSPGAVARALGVTADEIVAAIEEGDSGLFDRISQWITTHADNDFYGANTGNGGVEILGEITAERF